MKEMSKNFVSNSCFSDTQTRKGVVSGYDTPSEESMDLAQAYVPFQPYMAPMEQTQSLVCGTAFYDLIVPYCSGWQLYRFAKEV